MADQKISALTDGGTPAAGDAFVIARSGQNFRLGPLRLDALVTAAPPTAAVNLNSQRITNLGAPSASTDAATKAYVDAAVVVGSTPPLSSVLVIGNDAGATTIINLGYPALKTDAATKGYVDSVTFNVRSGTAYTIVATDQGKVISTTNAGGCSVLVDNDANTGWPTFDSTKAEVIYLRQFGGTLTVTKGTGVTVNSRGNILTLAGSFAWATLVRTAANTWDLYGDIA